MLLRENSKSFEKPQNQTQANLQITNLKGFSEPFALAHFWRTNAQNDGD